MSFLFPQAASAPPPPPSLASTGIALQAADARNAAAAASGKAAFGRTIKTSPQGAPDPSKAITELKPQMTPSSVFGG